MILMDHDEFRYDNLTAEESCEIELDYLDVLGRAAHAGAETEGPARGRGRRRRAGTSSASWKCCVRPSYRRCS